MTKFIIKQTKIKLRTGKAFLSNQVARFSPKLYVKLTHEKGRGVDEEDAREVADYFIRCFSDYQTQIGLNDRDFNKYLAGKAVLEHGPGDILGRV